MGQCSDEEDLEASVLLRSMARSVFWFFTFQETGAAVDRAALAREASFKFFRCFCDGHLSWQDIDGEPLEDDDEPAEARLCSDSYGNLYHTKLFLFSGSPQVSKPNASWTEDRINALRSFGLRVNLQEPATEDLAPERSSRAEENHAWWSKASGLDREDRGL